MKIDRDEHPILMASDFSTLLDQLSELEMQALKEALEQWTEFDDVLIDKRFKKDDVLSMLQNTDMIEDEVENLKYKLKAWLKILEPAKPEKSKS